MKVKVVVLGAGISGLSAGYFLSKYVDTIILEKSERVGGWLGTNFLEGHLFERGPRTLRLEKKTPLWGLIEELGLTKRLIFGNPQARKRYFFSQEKLYPLPKWNFSLIFSLLKEFWVQQADEDETVWEFACRRFGVTVAEEIFDPMITGIYGGNLKKISACAALPRLKKWEQDYGSIMRGFIASSRSNSLGLFSFQNGTEELVQALKQRGPPVLLNHRVETIRWLPEGVEVQTNQGIIQAEALFSALPYKETGKLLAPQLLQMKGISMSVVDLIYPPDVLNKKGFGYLVSSKEKEAILGTVFNSCAFPQQGTDSRLSVMLRGSEWDPMEAIEEARRGLKRHLQIETPPLHARVQVAENIFPEMEVGYMETVKSIEQHLKETNPHLYLLGNYWEGVGVADCVARSQRLVEDFMATRS